MANENPAQTNQENPPAASQDNPPPVKLESKQGKDPQLVLTFASPDGGPFNARISVDLTVYNAHNHAKDGHAQTADFVLEPRVTIPINFPDSMSEWSYGAQLQGAMLAFQANVTLEYTDGTIREHLIQDHFAPTNNPPIESDFVINQYESDQMELSVTKIAPFPIGSVLLQGKKYVGPRGWFYFLVQHDGNLVVYTLDEDHFRWGSHNNLGVSLSGNHALLQDDGNLQIFDEHNNLIWSTKVEGGVALSINKEGLPVILNMDGGTVWTG